VISALSQAGASAAVASGSSGFSTVDAILVIVVVVVVLVVVGRFSRRLALRPRGLRASERDEETKAAAAADVAELERDGRHVSPDAPGVQQDDL
jgi:membrane protein implicated in regulation of membrane protease activity